MERWNDRRLLLLFGTDQAVESPRNLPGVIPQLVELVPISLGEISELHREKDCVGDFRQEPREMSKNRRNSLGPRLAAPSAMFAAAENAARRICEVRP